MGKGSEGKSSFNGKNLVAKKIPIFPPRKKLIEPNIGIRDPPSLTYTNSHVFDISMSFVIFSKQNKMVKSKCIYSNYEKKSFMVRSLCVPLYVRDLSRKNLCLSRKSFESSIYLYCPHIH